MEPLWTKADIEKQVSRIEKGALSCYDSLYHMSREYEAERATLTARIAELEQQLAQAQDLNYKLAERSANFEEKWTQAQAGRWMPLPDGQYCKDGELDVTDDGQAIGIVDGNDDDGWQWYYVGLPENIRLCRWQEGSK